MLTLLATLISTAAADETPNVAPHQVVVATPAGFLHEPPRQVVQAVSRAVTFAEPPIQIGYLRTATTKVSVQGGGVRFLLAVDTPGEAARLNNGPLTSTQLETLRRGGMLVWNDGGRARQVLVLTDITTDRVLATVPVLANQVDFQRSWTSSASGVLLTSTAQHLKLPVARGALVYTNVPDAQAATVKQAVLDAGLDPGHIDIYEPPAPITVPLPFYAAIVGLGLSVLATTIAVAKTQVLTLRSYLGRLIAIGLSPRWARHVLLLQSVVVILLSTALALLLAIPPVLIAVLRLPDFALSVPWSWLGLTIGTFYAAAAVATLLSSRRLRSSDRLTV